MNGLTCRSALSRLQFVFRRLVEAEGPVKADSLAGEWEVSRKTIYRDFETLKTMGLDLRSNRDGYAVLGVFIDGPRRCPFCNEFKSEKPSPPLSKK